MSVEFDRGSPGKFDSRTLSRKKLLVGGLGVVTITNTNSEYDLNHLVIVSKIVTNSENYLNHKYRYKVYK